MSTYVPRSQGQRQQQRTPLSDHSSHINNSDFTNSRGERKTGPATRVSRNIKTSIPPPRDGPRSSSNINTKTFPTRTTQTDNRSSLRMKKSSVRSDLYKYESTAAFDPFESGSTNSGSMNDADSVVSSTRSDFSNPIGLNKALEEMKESRANSQQKRMKLHQERQNRERSLQSEYQKKSFDTEKIPNSENVTLSMDEYEKLMSTAKKRDDIGRIVQERLSFAADNSTDGEMKERYEKEISRLRKELDEIKFFNDLDESFDADGNKINKSTAASILYDARDAKSKLDKALQSTKALEMENTYLRQKNQILLKEKKALSANVELFQTTNLSSDKKTQLVFHLQSQVISLKSCLEEETLHRERAETSMEEMKCNFDEQMGKLVSDNNDRVKELEDLLIKKEKVLEEALEKQKIDTDVMTEELDRKDDELEELNQNLTNGLALVKELEEELTPLQEKVDSQIETIERSEVEINNYKYEIEKLKKELKDTVCKAEEEMNATIQSDEEKIHAKENEMKQMKEEYDNVITELENQREQVKRLNEQLTSVKTEANEKMEQLIQSCDKEVDEKDDEISKLRENLENVATNLIVEFGKKTSALKSQHEEELGKIQLQYESNLNEQTGYEEIARKELQETLRKLGISEKKVSELNFTVSNLRKEFEDHMKSLEEDYAKEFDHKSKILDQKLLEIQNLENKILSMSQSQKVSLEELSELESKQHKALKVKDQQIASQRRKWSNADQKLRQELRQNQETQIQLNEQLENMEKKYETVHKELLETKFIADKNENERKKSDEEVLTLRAKLEEKQKLSSKSDHVALQRKIRQLESKLNDSFSRSNGIRSCDEKDKDSMAIAHTSSTGTQHFTNTSPQKEVNCSVSVGTRSTSSCTTASVEDKLSIQKKESSLQPSPTRIKARKKIEEAALKRYMSHRQKRNQHM